MANKNRAKHLANRRAWWAKNKTGENKKRRELVGEARERKLKRNRDWYAGMSPEQRQRWSTYMRAYSLNRRLGISLVKWLAIFKLQGEKCACCGVNTSKRWHTDHDHKTGAIRGILCHVCNPLLGMLGDNLRAVEDSTRRLTDYLKGAEPVWKNGGVDGELLVWEPRH